MMRKKSASVPLVLPVTVRSAFDTVPCPELYAAAARYQEPKRLWSWVRYVRAASVDFAGFFRSSTLRPTARPYSRAVGLMNCHSPTAFTGDLAVGLKLDSIS